MPEPLRFSDTRRRPRWWVVALIVALHVAAIYGLVRAFAPQVTGSIERSVVSAFTLEEPQPEPTPTLPPPPPPRPEPDEGAQGDPGARATPRPVAQPSPAVVVRPTRPQPRATSTGEAVRSGAAESGTGTGLAGTGSGTGAGGAGDGTGGAEVPLVEPKKPVLLSGSINSASDFPVPPGGRRARVGNRGVYKLTVGVDGRARDCVTFRASGDPEADRIVCRLIEQRFRFVPARNARNEAVPAPFYWEQRWFAGAR